MQQRPFSFADEGYLVRIKDMLDERARWSVSEPECAEGELPRRGVPSLEHLRLLVETAFLASCGREEGRHARFQIEYLIPEDNGDTFILSEPHPLDVKHLLKLAPGLEEVGLFVGVMPSASGHLVIWGFGAKQSGAAGIRAFEPGHVAVQSFGATLGIVSIDHCMIVDYDQVERTLIRLVTDPLPCPEILPEHEDVVDVLLMAGRAMRAHGCGGTFLFVPVATAGRWIESLATPIPIETRSRFTSIQDGLRQMYANGQPRTSISRKIGLLDEAFRFLGRLTAIDGAAVISWDFSVLALGAKIKPVSSRSAPQRVRVDEPFEGTAERTVPIAALGWGTRHRSAAQFVHDQHDSVALVCSQDGEVSFFAWDPLESKVLVLRHLDALYNKPYK